MEALIQRLLLDEMRAGVLMGESTKNMMERLTLAMNMAKREAVTLVRTFTQTANVEASRAAADANAGILRGWKWSATLEPGYRATGRGTCVRCAGRERVQDGRRPAYPPSSTVLLCARVDHEVVADLGIDADELRDAARPYTMARNENIDEGLRRTLESREFHTGDYASWFQKQNRAFQLNAVGPEPMRLLKEGKAIFRGLVDASGNAIQLERLRG